MANKALKTLLGKPLQFVFGLFTRNKHVLYAVVKGRNQQRIEDTIRLKRAFEHVTTTCELFRKNAWSLDKVIVDVGGGSGNTMMLFQQFFPELHVHVFEPIPSNQELILDKGTKGATLHPYALGKENGHTSIYLTQNITSSSLLVPGNPTKYGEEIKKTGELKIEVKRLDSVLENVRIGIMKMDVQGFEMNVMEGSGKLLEQTNYVVMEVNNHAAYEGAPTYFELDEFMRKNGFQLIQIFPGRILDGRLLDWDAVYEKLELKQH